MNLKNLLTCAGFAFVLNGLTLGAQSIAQPGDLDFDLKLLNDACQEGDASVKRLAEIREKAAQGDPQAECELGWTLDQGKLGVAKDRVEAMKWYRKAADQNYALAQFTLGNCYFFGLGLPQDYAEAVKWYRKAVEQNRGLAAFRLAYCYGTLGDCYANGQGVPQDCAEAVKWYRKAAAQGNVGAQFVLGARYLTGQGVPKDHVEAAKWFRGAAEQGDARAQFNLGVMYDSGDGVPQDYTEALEWYRKAANQGHAGSQNNLGFMYGTGRGVPQDYVEAYRWYNLAAARGETNAVQNRDILVRSMTPDQIAEGQQLAREFTPGNRTPGSNPDNSAPGEKPTASGTGFFITDDGYLISNYHVVKGALHVRLVTSAGTISSKVVQVDEANDLALLKVDGRFVPLPIISSRAVKLGGTVATVGFPDPGLQGFAPKLAKGEISALRGARDDARYFQISAPLQPGNSGGALVDDHGNVVGVVSAKLDAAAALASSGALPENVNYAIKSSFLLGFLESVPEAARNLKEPDTNERRFEDVVRSAQEAAVLVLVY